MINEKDIYDLEVERLTKNPKEIRSGWLSARPLFAFVHKTNSDREHRDCGCLTLIRMGTCEAISEGRTDWELTNEIRSDNRLPSLSNNITVEHLPIFAEWQRKIDKRYNRKP